MEAAVHFLFLLTVTFPEPLLHVQYCNHDDKGPLTSRKYLLQPKLDVSLILTDFCA